MGNANLHHAHVSTNTPAGSRMRNESHILTGMNPRRPKRNKSLLPTALAVITLMIGHAPALPTAGQIIKETGVTGGMVVHLGCGDGKLTAALHAHDGFLVHGLTTGREGLAAAREHIRSKGLYGPVSVDHFDGRRMPYADNLVNLVVADELRDVPMAEVMRVLAPEGVAWVGGKKTVKPRPDTIDEWTHFLHDASGNAVAHDSEAGPPRRMQWLGSPRWSRHHDHMSSVSAVVTANGRLFYIFDEATRFSILLPPRWKLIARDAFNGTILWKRPIASWHSHLMRLKSGPADLPRRLVAAGDTVYATLAYDAPLSALDAATGKTLRTYEGTAATTEVVHHDGVLFLVTSDPATRKSDLPNAKAAFRRGGRWLRDNTGQAVMAVRAGTGEVLWKKPAPVAPLTLAADSKRVLFFDGEGIRCLNRNDGRQLWKSEPLPSWERMPANYGPRLVIYEDVVLFSGGEKMKPHKGGGDTMCALSLDSGEKLWSAPHPESGYQSPEDLLVSGGLVWCGQTTSTNHSGKMTGRDPRTGEVRIEFAPQVKPYWFHHRCHMAKATDNYLLMSRTGIEFIDPAAKKWELHHWVRGACLYGIMPANGMVYAPQHPCACYPEAKLYGFTALAPARKGPRLTHQVANDERLEKGEAYGHKPDSAAAKPGDWPAYRGGASRSGFNKTPVPGVLKPKWETKLDGKLSSVTVAEGKVFVASVDHHAVHALDEQTGRTRWSFTAGGRVDSPPTVWSGRVLFGSADGYAYCLRASDGALIWRYLAAPMDERHVAFEQVESVWPVHGAVLVLDAGTSASGKPEAQFVAGRSMFLDGGLRFHRLDAKTGRPIAVHTFDEHDPETGKNLQTRHKILQMPVALPDILASDGKRVYMKSQVLDLTGKRLELGPNSGDFGKQASVQQGETAHIFCPSGYLDDSWWHRTYWVFGRSFAGGHGGYFRAGQAAPSGRILVSNGDKVYGFGRKPQYYRWTTPIEHQLFASTPGAGNDPAADEPEARRGKKKPGGKEKKKKNKAFKVAHDWTMDIPIFVRSMAMADRTLFVMGPPDLVNEDKLKGSFYEEAQQDAMRRQVAALDGRFGAKLLAVSAADGKTLAEHQLDHLPVWDGMAAANGRLFLSTTNGHVLCLGP